MKSSKNFQRIVQVTAIAAVMFTVALIPTKTHAATGDITAVRIAGDTTHNGWTAEIDIEGLATGGTYNLGMGTNNDPTNAKISFTVSSPGFDTTGANATTTRTIYATKYVRLPYPSNASVDESSSGGTLTIKVALSDFIYAADTSITANISSGVYTKSAVSNSASSSVIVTNNSKLQYPKSVGRWAWPGYERVTGDFLVEAVAFNRFAKNAKPLAAMVFTANDQHGHTVTQTVTDMTLSTRSGDANPVQVYAATIPVSTLTQNDIIEVNFKAYPWVGTSSAILNSATTSDGFAQPNERLGPLYEINDKSGTYGYAYAYVKPGGSDSTGTVYSTQSAAEAGSAFLTIKKASDAIQTYNNTNYGRNEAGGGTILLGAGTTTYPGLTTVDVGTMNTWLTITRTSTTSKSAVILDTDGNNRTSRITRLKITGITIRSSNASTIITGRGATDALWLHDNTIDRTGTGIVAYLFAAAYATQNTIVNHDTTGFSPFSTNHSGWALIRGNNNTAATAIKGDVYAFLGNAGVTPLFKENANTAGQAASDNSIFAYNSLYGITSAPNSFSMTSTSTGFAVVGNVMEKTTTTELLFCVSCDLSTATSSNVMIWHNTFAGERGNFGYNENGSAYLGRFNWSQKFNIYEEWNTKTDDFVGGGAANGNRTGNWPIIYNVGSFSNISKQENFRGEFDGLSTVYGPTTGTLEIGFTSDRSYVGTAAGNGIYTFVGTSTAIDFATTTSNTQAVLPYDFAGNVRYGMPEPGAYEYQPTYTMGTHNVATSSVVRVYGDEKWRPKTATTSNGTAAMSVSLSGSNTSQWLDIAISLWNTTGTYQKTWTETSSSTGLTNTSHTIGGLGASALFQVKVDNVVGQDMTGASCTAGVCTSNGSGQITFTYTGTYATTHTFDVNQVLDTIAPTVEMTVPSNGATVGGAAVTVTASSSDDVAVSGVLFKLDTNTEIAAEVTNSPYTISWDSTGVADGSHTLIAVARDGSNNRATSSAFTITVDNTAPVRSAGSPSSALPLNTSTTTLSLTTNETATCKYSASPGTAYGSMSLFSTTTSTTHTTVISGLSNGTSYSYYVKCSDAQGNTNGTDYTISFSVIADTTAPSISITAPADGATVSGASVSLTANASDDVSVAGVQFKVDTNTNIGSEDTSAPYAVTWDSTGIADGIHTLIAVARDGTNNRATSTSIMVLVDNTAPVRSSGSPSGTLTLNTTGTTVSLSTDESATCKYSTSASTAYSSMTAFTATGGTSHSVAVTGLSNGGSYVYYVKCADGWGNTNSNDYSISFSVASDATSPTAVLTAPLNNAVVSGSSVSLTATANDDVSVAGVQFKVDTNTLVGSEDTSSPYTMTWDSTGVADGSHTLIAVARDGTGNYGTSSIITVTVDNTAPSRSAGSPSGALSAGTTATTISLTTDEAATCKYSTSSGASYASMTTFSTTGETSHSALISGLADSTSYSYYVKCSDNQGNINATNYTISFSVATDVSAPTVTLTLPLAVSTVSGSSVSLTATASDNEAVAGVQFKVDTNTLVGSEDTSSPYTMTWDSTGVADGSHTVIAVARDTTNNRSTSSPVSIVVDNTAPVRSIGTPSGSLSSGTTNATLSLATNEAATCKYSTTASTAYSSMTLFSTTTETSHATDISGLTDSTSYTYYVKCADGQGNVNASDYAISFSVAASSDTTAPVISSINASAANTTATITWNTDEAADAQVEYGMSADIYTASSTLDSSMSTSHSITLSGLTENTTYHYRVLSTDSSSNIANSSDQTFTTNTVTITVTHRSGGGGGGGGSQIPSSSGTTGNSITPAGNVSSGALSGVVNSLNSVGQRVFVHAAGLRSSSEEVRALQKFLNVKGFTVASAGPGSPGHEINIFGAATRLALIRFQKAQGIDPTGYFGPLTRAAVNTLLMAEVGAAPSSAPSAPVSSVTPAASGAGATAGTFSRTLSTGSMGNDVKNLQKFLNGKGFTIVKNGPGSPGRETTVFGSATQYQLRQFQKAYGIVPATGVLGPLTRAKIEALLRQ